MKFFCKNKGTISVFLTIILVPVLLLGGLTTDAARICMSKAVISDAGEMAMNAGLAQYNEELHDEYGLLVMDRSPEAMESDLEKFFNGSLNGTGMPGEEDYKKILDLLTKKFDAINVQGSEIYQTEVEKQQILEYMKYRAPVCLTELVVEKIKELKNSKKMAEAMKKQMEFSEAMEDCHNEFQKAKEALDTLNGVIDHMQSQAVGQELSRTKEEYENIVSNALLMWAAIQEYDDRLKECDWRKMEGTVDQFLRTTKNIDWSTPFAEATFNGYMSGKYYVNTIDAMGGIGKLTENDGQEQSSDNLEELKNEYDKRVAELKKYPKLLLDYAQMCIDEHSGKLKGYLDSADSAEDAAKTACDRLAAVKKKLKKAKEAFDGWEKANGELKGAGNDTGSMDADVKLYRDFFYSSNGNGKADFEELDSLISDTEQNQEYFHKLKDVLKGEKFWEQSIAVVPASDQYEEYKDAADSCMKGTKAEYVNDIKRIRDSEYFPDHYKHKDISEAGASKSISGHPFYKRLQEYCRESNKEDSQQEQNEANGRLEESKKAGEEANKADDYPDFKWSSIGELPSSKVGKDASKAEEQLTDLNASGDVNNSSARKETTKKFQESMDAAVSFLDKVDEIVSKGLENLYISEYAMQMFSYYTVNKKDGQDRPEGEIIGISGYKLSEHAAYQAECEYILWGKDESKINVLNTVMMIFGIRLLFNSFFAFTDHEIDGIAFAMATTIAGGWAPYLVPIIKVVIKLGFAGVETASDITKIKQGYGVVLIKKTDSWATAPYMGDNTKKKYLTLDYSEYMRIFLNLSMLTGNGTGILGRIADCIQANQPNMNLLEGYTMLSVQAEVSSRTTFMRKISDWSGSKAWGFPDDTYTISYQSILGY